MAGPVGRLAPTPSGHLHLGNALAFAVAWLSVRQAGGRLLLRFEDVDRARARDEIEAGQRRDLAWLGLTWDHEVPRQSDRDYALSLARLSDHTYRCTCTRRQVRAAGGVYPGTCRDLGHTDGAVRLRLPDGPVAFVDRVWGSRSVRPADHGDPVLRRRDGVFTYNHAVVTDDLRDGVTEVVRGADLLDYTAVQACLYDAHGAPSPTWLHAPLVLGPDGRKLSKSHRGLELRALRDAGWAPAHVWRLLWAWLGSEGDGPDPTKLDISRIPRATIHLRTVGCPPPDQSVRWEQLSGVPT